MTKRKTCDIQRGVHKFNGERPFRWQRCHCKTYTFGELQKKVRARQKENRRLERAEEKREAATPSKQERFDKMREREGLCKIE